MVELIVVTHGSVADALKETAEMLVGEQGHIRTFGLHLGESVDELREKVAAAIEVAHGQGEVMVITDMLAGSPFNIASSLMSRYQFEHLTGINFPVFLEILSNRDECTAAQLMEMATSSGRDTLMDARKFFEEVE
ncbi:MAG: PTS sugar transporter subunit IIA [Lawsonibacter sp.]|nr:PTS sugar transporter subunit IIA [Lawsonibacter sp.]